jgi:hypothetical protein
MSWLFGFYAKHQIDTSYLSYCHPKAISTYNNPQCYIAVGGNENLICYQNKEELTKFFICGLGINWDCDHTLNENDWGKILESYPDSLNKLNGHFCGLLVNKNSFRFFTDQLGLREIFLLETPDGWYFSTRLDWLLKVAPCEIDFNVFASRWLSFNQLSNKSIVKNIIRLNQGTVAEIIDNRITISNRTWIPQKTNPVSAEDFSERLNKIIMLGKTEGESISLSLSGGMDSRVLFSFLLKSGYKNWNCHTFHTDSPKDSIIAEKILNDFHVPYKLLGKDSYNLSETDNLFEYIGSTFMTQSAFNSVKLMNYSGLPGNDLIIDGGFGEIWRREYLALLNMRGRKFIETKDYAKVAEFLRFNRANIFNHDITEVMNEGVVEQIRDVFNVLPDAIEVGIENWLDLFTIKTRLVNFFAPEQARLDNLIKSYMPFAQISLMSDLLNLPLKEKKNNKLFKELIRKSEPDLTKYSLVIGNVYYPFWFSTLQKRLYLIINSRLIKTNNEIELDKFLGGKKEFILDSLESVSVKTYSPYNYEEISQNVNSYYKGTGGNGNYVNWFLTFEVFRQILEGCP